MQISAINLNNNFGNYSKKKTENSSLDKLENVDYTSIADTLENGNVERKTTPVRYFLITAALTAASLFAARGASIKVINKVDGKFPVFGAFEVMGKSLNKTISGIKNRCHHVAKVKTTGDFFRNSAYSLADRILVYGKKGLEKADIKSFKGVKLNDLYAKNAIKKATAATIGTGAAALTIASRYKDEDGNGIPDKAEKALGATKEIIQTIPAIVEAVNIA